MSLVYSAIILCIMYYFVGKWQRQAIREKLENNNLPRIKPKK
jgi:hypothetical protein